MISYVNGKAWKPMPQWLRQNNAMTDVLPSSQRGEDALVALRQIVGAIERDSRQLAKTNGLSPSKIILLQVLAREGGLSASEISGRISLSQASVTTLIDKLSQRKLIKRRQDDKDKRRIVVSITQEGRSLLADAPGLLTESFLKRFDSLKPWEQSALLAALEKISAMLSGEDLDAAPILDIGPITDALD